MKKKQTMKNKPMKNKQQSVYIYIKTMTNEKTTNNETTNSL